MPPKKKLCRSKDQRSIIEVFRGSSDESENSSNDQTKPAPLEDTPKQPPTNKFIPKESLAGRQCHLKGHSHPHVCAHLVREGLFTTSCFIVRIVNIC